VVDSALLVCYGVQPVNGENLQPYFKNVPPVDLGAREGAGHD
jgi:hypothetical protein